MFRNEERCIEPKNQTVYLVALAMLVIAALACGLLPPQPPTTAHTPAATLEPTAKPSPTHPVVAQTINSSAIELAIKEVAYCKALAPEDWGFNSVPPYVGADLFSPDKSIHAAWGIASIYKTLFPTVKSALIYLLDAMGYKDSAFVGEPIDIGYGFMGWEFTSSIGRQGKVIYRTYDLDTAFYVISVYIGATTNENWESKGAQALSAAISIRCVSQLRPPSADVNYECADPSNKADNPEVDLSEKWSEAILGYENVYSPTTGEHYQAPLNSYWESGPDGGGYYRELPGGGFEKLEYGFGDY